MKYWLLGLATVVCALALLVCFRVAPELVRFGMIGCYALAGVTAWITALSYSPRDRLRWAWLAFGTGYLIALASKVFVGDNALIPTFSPTRAAVWSVGVLLLNIGSVTGLTLFARVWSGTGLSPSWRGRATLMFLVLAVLVDGRGLVFNFRGILAGRIASYGIFTSALSDIIAVSLVGPIFATAIALRGGILMRPWVFLFAASVCWLADDYSSAIPRNIGQHVDVLVRSAAVLLSAAAALAQLWVKREVRNNLEG